VVNPNAAPTGVSIANWEDGVKAFAPAFAELVKSHAMNPSTPAAATGAAEPARDELSDDTGAPTLVPTAAPTHGVDFSWIRCKLGGFTFTTNQRHVVKALWDDWAVGGLGVSQSHLIELAGGGSPDLRSLFRDDPAWGTLIITADRKAVYKLDLPPG